MTETARRLLNSSWTERGLALRAFVWLGMIDLALRARGFRWVLHHARALPADTARRLTEDDRERASRYARLIGAVARRFPVRAECLHCALTLHYWLRAEALPSEFCLGVRVDDAELKAHAWIELEGTPIGESRADVAAFAPLRTLGGGGVESLAWS